jgi:hypothetical protein
MKQRGYDDSDIDRHVELVMECCEKSEKLLSVWEVEWSDEKEDEIGKEQIQEVLDKGNIYTEYVCF